MASSAAPHGPGRFRALVRSVVVALAIITAGLLLSSTNHVDDAPVTGAVVAGFDNLDNAQTAADEVGLDGALTGVALGCALLGLCCLFALTVSIRLRRSTTSVSSPSTPYQSALSAALPRPTLIDPQRLSISRT